MSDVARKLGLLECIGLSTSILAPTAAMAFNVSLAAQVAGRAAPLSFAIGTIVIGIVGLSFVCFSRRIAHAGSAFAYIAATFGYRAGVIAGWTLLLTYLTYTAGVSALAGNFLQAALDNSGVTSTSFWIAPAAGSVLFATYCAWRDMRIAARLMLALEGLAVLAILTLSFTILVKVGIRTGLSVRPFIPAPEAGGWSGVGYGLVFAVLSFAGFEGAATLGEETINPYRSIPRAMAGTIILAGGFFVLTSYAEVIGYGTDQVKALAGASAPLNDLAERFLSKDFATLIDLAAAVSAIACALGSLSAAARLLYALGRAGLVPHLGRIDPTHRTPDTAIVAAGTVSLSVLLTCALFAGAANSAAWLATIGTLALIPVYMAVTAAEFAVSMRARRTVWALIGLAGTLMLCWTLYNSVYPAPKFPGDLWPYLVIAWILVGALLPAWRSASLVVASLMATGPAE